MTKTTPVIDRFQTKYIVTDAGCWRWTDRLNEDGYGRLLISRRTAYAHRIAYELYIGPIPIGLTIDHLCRNRACVNPGHLETVTNAENHARIPAHLRRRLPKTHCKRGHLFNEANTYHFITDGHPARQCRACKAQLAREKRRHRSAAR